MSWMEDADRMFEAGIELEEIADALAISIETLTEYLFG